VTSREREALVPNVPDEAVRLAVAARADLLADHPSPMVLSEETLTRLMLEAAMPALERDIRARIAASLRRAADGRREYASGFPESEAQRQLLMHAQGDESSAAIIENPAHLLGVIPSWRWTEWEAASVREDKDRG
jgi:hypothetical protein